MSSNAPAASDVRPLDAIAVASLVLCCAIWGVNQVAMKVANEGISPIFQAGLRSILAGGLLWLWMSWRGIAISRRDGTLGAGILVGLTFAGNFMCIGPGLALTEASRGVLFLYSAPFFVALGAHLLIPTDRLTWPKLAGLVLAFAGLVVMVVDRLGTGERANLTGDLLCLAAGAFWAASTLIVRLTALRATAPEKTLLYQLVVSAPVLLAAAWLQGEPGIVDLQPRIVGAFVYTVVLTVLFSYALWFWLLRHYPASQVSAFTFLGPLFAVAAGHTLLGEAIGWQHAVAMLLIVAGLVLVSRPH